MEEVIVNVKETSFKIIKIDEHNYELKKQRSNGKYYKISRFNAGDLYKAIKYVFETKLMEVFK